MGGFKDKYKHYQQDLDQEAAHFLNRMTALLQEQHSDLKLSNIVAVSYGHIFMSKHIQSLIEKAGYSYDYAYQFFQSRLSEHVQQAKKVADNVPDDPVLLTSLSAKEIKANQAIADMPGTSYHKDGGGKPISTKITLLTKNEWQGGELHLVDTNDQSVPKLDQTVGDRAGDDQVLLQKNEAVLFNNRELYHAVNSDNIHLTSGSMRAYRVIYQERMNDAKQFNKKILEGFGLDKVTSLLNPIPVSKRAKEDHELTQEEREHIQQHETPDPQLRSQLQKSVANSAFTQLSDQLDKDGVVIMPNYFEGSQLEDMQQFFKDQIEQKPIDKFLQQSSFNGAVDASAKLTESRGLSAALVDPTLLALNTYHFGKPAKFANWRGYRLEPCAPICYRAWDWHNDQKRKEIKVMILLSDVGEDDQAMRAIKGSHKKWWNMQTQRDSKYTIEEALEQSDDDNITLCHGQAGTVIVFDTNIVHSGFRNLSKRRDVLTFNFVPGNKDAAIFDVGELHNDIQQSLQDYFKFIFDPNRNDTSNEEIIATLEQHRQRIDKTLSEAKIVTTEQDLSSERVDQLIEDYNKTPVFEQFKPRYCEHKSDSRNLNELLFTSAVMDAQADLDLTVRMGRGDVNRDKQFVIYRDAKQDSESRQQLADRLTKIDVSSDYAIEDQTIERLQEWAQQGADKASKLIEDENYGELAHRCKDLVLDLKDALGRSDSIQRLRTNMVYLYFTLESIANELPTNDNDEAIEREDQLNNILKIYTQVVKTDDAAHCLLNCNHNDIKSPTSPLSEPDNPYRQSPGCNPNGFFNGKPPTNTKDPNIHTAPKTPPPTPSKSR